MSTFLMGVRPRPTNLRGDVRDADPTRLNERQDGHQHRLEVVHDGPVCWAECSCKYIGEVRCQTWEAHADAERHERDVYARTGRLIAA